jgi:hypothetical protein
MTDQSPIESDVLSECERNDHNVEPLSDEVAQETSQPAWTPPNGGYGWVCVACCFFINGHTWGINSVCLL